MTGRRPAKEHQLATEIAGLADAWGQALLRNIALVVQELGAHEVQLGIGRRHAQLRDGDHTLLANLREELATCTSQALSAASAVDLPATPLCQHAGSSRRWRDVDLDHGNGDADFIAWYAVAAREVFASLAGLSGDKSAAEEATSEAFIRAYARWPQVRQMERRNAWVFKVALNELRSVKRRRRREVLIDNVAREAWQPLSEHDPELWAAVAGLPERTRQVVALRYIADLPEADIAAALGVTRGTVATLLSRARRNLAVVLGDDFLETCR